jgi:acyl-CoA synthetase (AMP-forming)/AMP-acid ligase II
MRQEFPSAMLANGYGLTESTALATVINGSEWATHPASVGRLLPTVDIEIRDPGGRVLPEGTEGDIYIRSPLVMLQYWRRPEATAESIAAGRWLRSGDIGCMVDGRLYLASRRRDLIIRGGENVYPLAAFVGEKLAPFKVPSHWEIRDTPLPRNATGKVLKQVLTGEGESQFVEE